MRKIHIFYAHYNISGKGNKARPHWFDYEKCFINLLNSIKNEPQVTLNIVMDGKIEDNWISKYREHYVPSETKGGNVESITKNVYRTAYSSLASPDDLIYILENDYLHRSNWVEEVRTLFNTYEGIEYISLYDHADKYFEPMYENLLSKLVVTGTSHWRTTPSTCGSYITTFKIFQQDYLDHTGVTVPIGDHHKWLYLNKTKGRAILTPIPGLSTHCMEGLLSPTLDWSKL
jgi:hypothetical protein